MKVVIAGSRDIIDYSILLKAIKECPFQITEVISGRARGVDTLGEQFAEDYGLKLHPFPADWKRLGNAAGPIRNAQMADFADAVLCVWDGKSPGTKDMMNQARKRGLPLYVFKVDPDTPDLREFID